MNTRLVSPCRAGEVKSLRAGKANIGDSYVILKDGEASCSAPTLRPWPWLPPTMSATRRAPVSCCSTSVSWTRCTAALTAKVHRRRPVAVLEERLVQSENRVAKGKKQHDKRTDLKDREWALDKARIMKHAGRNFPSPKASSRWPLRYILVDADFSSTLLK